MFDIVELFGFVALVTVQPDATFAAGFEIFTGIGHADAPCGC
jgi:hypothetical protein